MNSYSSLEEVSVSDLMERYNLIVPEIQREYVWGHNYHNILDAFFKDVSQGLQQSHTGAAHSAAAASWLAGQLSSAPEEVSAYLQALVKNASSPAAQINIGFLYSYRPDYYVFNDRNEDLYLIDGQQRFTTLFLMLFYFAIKEGRRSDFLSLFRFDQELERIAFDYRVRSLTHSFFVDLIAFTHTTQDITNIRKRSWYLANYEGDPTINAVVAGLFPKLLETFAGTTSVYYDFVRERIKFWHFRTEETSQGEELYITMNSRGQQLADNENLRAALFAPESIASSGREATYWSERWEIWQDFFWRHRDHEVNSNADAGFNEFLRWVQICRQTEQQRFIIDDENEEAPDKKDILHSIKWEEDAQFNQEVLTLPAIDAYYNAVAYLFEQFPNDLQPFAKTFRRYQNFALLDCRWLSPATLTIAQIDLFQLLPVMQYVKQLQAGSLTPDIPGLFRLIRFFYNLRHNETVGKTAGLQVINALKLVSRLRGGQDLCTLLDGKAASSTLLNAEERRKLHIFKQHDQRREVEDQFWFAEDFRYSEGEIGFLIEWSNQVSKNVFDLNTFRKLLNVYTATIEQENMVRGDLLPTEAFRTSWDRVTWNHEFYRSETFLAFVLDRHCQRSKDLDTYLLQRRQQFIRRYDSVEALRAETEVQYQLYIYYIINQNILKPNPHWQWQEGLNIGVFSNFGEARSIFDEKHIFQFYRQHFRENYDKICWIQRELKLGGKKIQLLLDWSNLG